MHELLKVLILDEDASKKYLNLLEKRNQELFNELNRLRSKPRGKFAYILIVVGSLIFALSLDYSHSLAAFLSLALIFWGILFLYVKPADFIRQDLLLSVLKETSLFYSQLFTSIKNEGTPYYYSPKTLSDFTNVHLIILKDKNKPIDNNLLNNEYIRMTPLGLELSNLIEEESKLNFATSDLENVFLAISKILIDDIEIIKKFEPKIDGNTIIIKIMESILKSKKNKEPQILDYLNSSIACAIAKSTHKPVIIKDVYYELDGMITVIEYRIIDNEVL